MELKLSYILAADPTGLRGVDQLRVFTRYETQESFDRDAPGLGDEISVYVNLESQRTKLSMPLFGKNAKLAWLDIPYIKDEDILVAAGRLYDMVDTLDPV